MRRLPQQQQSNSNSPANRTLHTKWFNSCLLSEDQQTDYGLQTDLLSGRSVTTDMALRSISLLRVPYTKYLNECRSGTFLLSNSNRDKTARRSQWPGGLRRRSEAAWSLESRFRIPLRACMLVCCVWFMLCRYRLLRRADHPSRGVLPCVQMCVWSINLNSEAA